MIIRTITSFERDAVKEFYLALAADDRRKRFCCLLTDDTISRYVDGLDFTQHAVLGAFNDQAQLVGIAELAPGTEESELAFSVRPDMRCQGLGTKLMARILLHARISGVKRVIVMFLSDNVPMRRLARNAEMVVKTECSEAYASRELPAPSADEVRRWFMQEALAHSEYFSVLGISLSWLERSRKKTISKITSTPVPT